MLSVILFSAAGCNNTKDAAIQFATESISDTNNIKVEYYSPDPGNAEKRYYIKANSKAGELTLKCTSHNSIYFDTFEPSITVDPAVSTSEPGKWTAKVVSPNTIKFTFKPIDIKQSTEKTASKMLVISANTNDDDGKESTIIMVSRLLKSNDPLEFELQ